MSNRLLIIPCHFRSILLIVCLVSQIPGATQIMQVPGSAMSPLPVLRLSNGTTGIWLPEYDLGIAPTVTDWPVNGLQATLILGQKSLAPAVLAKAREPYLLAKLDSLAQAIPIQGGIRRQYQGPSGTVHTVTREWYIRDLEKMGHLGPQKELMIFRSQQLSDYNWNDRASAESPGSFQALGYPLSSFFGAPNARKAAYWQEDVPFRKKILDSLGQVAPAPDPPSIERDPYDPFSAYYRSDWPLRRTGLLLNLLEEKGNPVFGLVRTLSTQMGLTRQQASNRQLLQVYGPKMEHWMTTWENSSREDVIDSLATQIGLYYQYAHGPSIPAFLVEQARSHQKDYRSLAKALLAKSLLFHPEQWVVDYQQDPYLTLDRLEKDYGFRFFTTLLLETRATARKMRLDVPADIANRLTQHYLRQPTISLQEANGTLRAAPLTLDTETGQLISATLLPGLSGSLILTPQGDPYGILMVSESDAEYGQWLSPLAPTCSYIIPWKTVMKDIAPQD